MHQTNNLSTILNRKKINQYPIAYRNEDFEYPCGLQNAKVVSINLFLIRTDISATRSFVKMIQSSSSRTMRS